MEREKELQELSLAPSNVVSLSKKMSPAPSNIVSLRQAAYAGLCACKAGSLHASHQNSTHQLACSLTYRSLEKVCWVTCSSSSWI